LDFSACALALQIGGWSVRQAKRQEPQQAREPPDHLVVPCQWMGMCIPSTKEEDACQGDAPQDTYDQDGHLQPEQQHAAVSNAHE